MRPMPGPRVLFVKLSSLGDVIHHLPAVTELAERRVDAHIGWVVEEAYVDLVAMHPAVREAFAVSLRSLRRNPLAVRAWRRIAETRSKLARSRWDYVVDAQGLIKSAVVARFARRPAFGLDAASARERAQRFAWPTVTGEVLESYETAIERAAVPAGRARAVALRAGARPADGLQRVRPARIPSVEPELPGAGRRRAFRAARRVGVVGGAVVGIGLGALALQRIGVDSIVNALVAATPWWVLVGFALMCISMLARAESWHAILRAALPGARVRRRHAVRGVMIGVLMSATLPARLGEPSRALIVARRLGRVRERLPVVLGTLVSQTLLNLVALAALGSIMFATVGLFNGHETALVLVGVAPIAALVLVALAPVLLRKGAPSRFGRAQAWVAKLRGALIQARRGLQVFRNPRLGAWAAFMQLLAWAIQWFACYALLVALGLDHKAGLGAAAAVLFAVNVTAVIPATPSNIGVFQAACVAVLSAYGINHTDAFAYGIILQAVEIATAVIMGAPALVNEGLSFRDVRLRALHHAPVELRARRVEVEA